MWWSQSSQGRFNPVTDQGPIWHQASFKNSLPPSPTIKPSKYAPQNPKIPSIALLFCHIKLSQGIYTLSLLMEIKAYWCFSVYPLTVSMLLCLADSNPTSNKLRWSLLLLSVVSFRYVLLKDKHSHFCKFAGITLISIRSLPVCQSSGLITKPPRQICNYSWITASKITSL